MVLIYIVLKYYFQKGKDIILLVTEYFSLNNCVLLLKYLGAEICCLHLNRYKTILFMMQNLLPLYTNKQKESNYILKGK